jgi:tetratricopeptide (TPR) repeat protein
VVAYSENAVGWINAHLGRHAEALLHCGRALELHRESGSRSGAADTLDSMGYTYDKLADYGQAIAHYQQAVDIYRDIGDAENHAGALIRLGDMQLAAGLPARARLSWEQALAVVAGIPGVDTGEIRSRLTQLAAVDGPGIGEALPA